MVKRLEGERESAQNDPDISFKGDFSSYAHVLDCIHKSTNHVSDEMISKIAFDCLQSHLLSLENLALEPSDTIKFFRGIFWSR